MFIHAYACLVIVRAHTAGSFCPIGSTDPVACTPGNYCPSMGLASATLCPEGYVLFSVTVSISKPSDAFSRVLQRSDDDAIILFFIDPVSLQESLLFPPSRIFGFPACVRTLLFFFIVLCICACTSLIRTHRQVCVRRGEHHFPGAVCTRQLL